MPDRDGVYVSSGAFRSRSLEDILDESREAGIDALELGSGLACDDRAGERLYALAAGDVRFLVHNYFPAPEEAFVLNLAARSPETLARSRAHCRRAIDLAVRLRSPLFSVHAGFAVEAAPADLGRSFATADRYPLAQAQAIFIESLRELAGHAVRSGVRLAIENNAVSEENLVDGRNELLLGATADELLHTLDEVGSNALGLLIDVGHLNVTARSLGFDREAFLDEVRPYTLALHLSQNDGRRDSNDPFDEGAWFLRRLPEFRNAALVIEAYRLPRHQILRCRDIAARARTRPIPLHRA